jgi:hypothetical protein
MMWDCMKTTMTMRWVFEQQQHRLHHTGVLVCQHQRLQCSHHDLGWYWCCRWCCYCLLGQTRHWLRRPEPRRKHDTAVRMLLSPRLSSTTECYPYRTCALQVHMQCRTWPKSGGSDTCMPYGSTDSGGYWDNSERSTCEPHHNNGDYYNKNRQQHNTKQQPQQWRGGEGEGMVVGCVVRHSFHSTNERLLLTDTTRGLPTPLLVRTTSTLLLSQCL